MKTKRQSGSRERCNRRVVARRSVMAAILALFAVGCGEDGQPLDGGAVDASSDAPTDAADAAVGDSAGQPDVVSDSAGSPIITEVELVEQTGTHPGAYVCIEADCPSGKVVLGGGGEWDPAIVLGTMQPDTETSFQLCGDSTAGGVWTVQAICGRVSTKSMIVKNEEALPKFVGACIEAICPAGMAAVGGGASWNKQGLPVADRVQTRSGLSSVANSWGICGFTQNDTTWSASTICVEGIKANSREKAAQHPGPGGSSCFTSQCQAGERAVSGGGLWSLTSSLTKNALTASGSEWTLCGTTDTAEEWTAVVLCVPDG